MSTEHNKAITRRIYTDVNDGQRYDALDEICHADLLLHDPIAGEQQGIAAYRGLFAFFRQAFGDQRTELGPFVAEGDFVAVLHTHHAQHTGTFMGVAPTRNWLVVPGVELFRMRDGKIAEVWRFDADATLLAQVGLLPAPQAT